MSGRGFENRTSVGHSPAATSAQQERSTNSVFDLASQFFNKQLLPLGAAALVAVSSSEKTEGATPNQNRGATPAQPLAGLTAPQASFPSAHYNVQKGDTISAISKWFGISQSDIERANPGLNASKLHIGQTIFLPNIKTGFHIVAAGENLTTIAKKNGVTLEALLRANPAQDPRKLQRGSLLKIPAGRATTAVQEPHSDAPSRLPPPPQPKPPQAVSKPSPNLVAPSTVASQITSAKAASATTTAPTLATNSPGFWASILKVFQVEGGKTVDPNDRAHQGSVQMTNLGITPATMEQFLKRQGIASPTPAQIEEKIANLTTESAIPIYASGFWKAEYHALGPKLAFLVFDWGVNSHPSVAIKQLQRTLGLNQDGKIGAATIAQVQSFPEETICRLYLQRRKDFYRSIVQQKPDQAKFLKGWLARCDAALNYVNSQEFRDLHRVFEQTASKGCHLADPLLRDVKVLQWGVKEPALTRWVQESLHSLPGWQVSLIDGRFGSEMTRLTKAFQQHYNIPTTPESAGRWGSKETAILLGLLQSHQKAPKM